MDLSKLIAPAIAAVSVKVAGKATQKVAARRVGDAKASPLSPETPMVEAILLSVLTATVAAVIKTLATRKANQFAARSAARKQA